MAIATSNRLLPDPRRQRVADPGVRDHEVVLPGRGGRGGARQCPGGPGARCRHARRHDQDADRQRRGDDHRGRGAATGQRRAAQGKPGADDEPDPDRGERRDPSEARAPCPREDPGQSGPYRRRGALVVDRARRCTGRVAVETPNPCTCERYPGGAGTRWVRPWGRR